MKADVSLDRLAEKSKEIAKGLDESMVMYEEGLITLDSFTEGLKKMNAQMELVLELMGVEQETSYVH